MNLKSRTHYERQRLRAYERDRGRCVVCGEPADTGSIHHRQGRGGPDPHRLSNLLLVDEECHRRIHGSPSWAYENGYMVRRLGRDTPESVPVVVNGLPRWLDNIGSIYPRKEATDADMLH